MVFKGVAPYVGAWIETRSLTQPAELSNVAPYVGAWIETLSVEVLITPYQSRTLRGCVD